MNVDYKDVLKDLECRRNVLDAVILGIRTILSNSSAKESHQYISAPTPLQETTFQPRGLVKEKKRKFGPRIKNGEYPHNLNGFKKMKAVLTNYRIAGKLDDDDIQSIAGFGGERFPNMSEERKEEFYTAFKKIHQKVRDKSDPSRAATGPLRPSDRLDDEEKEPSGREMFL